MPGNENGGKVKVKCRLQNATPWPLRISYGGTVFYPFVYSPEVPRPEPHRSTTMVVTDMPVLFPGQSITETHEIGPGDWDFYADGWGTDRVLGCYALFSGWPFEKFMDNHPLPELKESKVDLEDVPNPETNGQEKGHGSRHALSLCCFVCTGFRSFQAHHIVYGQG